MELPTLPNPAATPPPSSRLPPNPCPRPLRREGRGRGVPRPGSPPRGPPTFCARLPSSTNWGALSARSRDRYGGYLVPLSEEFSHILLSPLSTGQPRLLCGQRLRRHTPQPPGGLRRGGGRSGGLWRGPHGRGLRGRSAHARVRRPLRA